VFFFFFFYSKSFRLKKVSPFSGAKIY